MFQVTRTQVRQYSTQDMAWAFEKRIMLRDERLTPEPLVAIRWSMTHADAWQVFEDWSTLPAVRAGVQRVKIIPVRSDR